MHEGMNEYTEMIKRQGRHGVGEGDFFFFLFGGGGG